MLDSPWQQCLTRGRTVHWSQVANKAQPVMTPGHKDRCGSCQAWPCCPTGSRWSKTADAPPLEWLTTIRLLGEPTMKENPRKHPKRNRRGPLWTTQICQVWPRTWRWEETGISPSPASGKAETSSAARREAPGAGLWSCLLLCYAFLSSVLLSWKPCPPFQLRPFQGPKVLLG